MRQPENCEQWIFSDYYSVVCFSRDDGNKKKILIFGVIKIFAEDIWNLLISI